jgi:hypothetical protein
MILKGTSGKDAELPISLFDATTGAAITGHTWVLGEVLVALPGGTFANATIANIVEKGRGKYALQLTSSETATTGGVQLILDTTNGYAPHSWEETILDIGTVVRDAILTYSFRSGRTVKGLLRRMDAFVTNKATGLIGAAVTFFQPDSATTEFSTTQDVSLGNRGTPDVTNSEA